MLLVGSVSFVVGLTLGGVIIGAASEDTDDSTLPAPTETMTQANLEIEQLQKDLEQAQEQLEAAEAEREAAREEAVAAPDAAKASSEESEPKPEAEPEPEPEPKPDPKPDPDPGPSPPTMPSSSHEVETCAPSEDGQTFHITWVHHLSGGDGWVINPDRPTQPGYGYEWEIVSDSAVRFSHAGSYEYYDEYKLESIVNLLSQQEYESQDGSYEGYSVRTFVDIPC